MPQIHAPDLSSAIRRAYGIRGAQGFDTVAPEIIPVSIVDDIRSGVAKQCAGRSAHAAVAARFSFCAIVASLQVLTKVKGVWLFSISGVQTTFEIIMSNQTSITVGTGTNKHYLDRRIAGRPSTILGSGDEVLAPTGESIVTLGAEGFINTWVPLNVTLSPVGGSPEAGSSRLIVHAGVVNHAIAASWVWEESANQPGSNVP